jgi:hypothetical protein
MPSQNRDRQKLLKEKKEARLLGAASGGALLGVSLGGPIGAIIGGVLGLVIGNAVNEGSGGTRKR